MSHEEEAKLAEQDALPGLGYYRRRADAYYRDAARGPGVADPAWEWEMHDAAHDVALVAAQAREATTRPDDKGRWEAAYLEWQRIAAIHAGLAVNLKDRP